MSRSPAPSVTDEVDAADWTTVSAALVDVRLALREAVKGMRASPRVQATPSSATRRALVVVVFMAVGMLTGDLSTVVAGAFGALQVGFIDVALPAVRLVRYIALNVVAIGATVLVSGLIGATWWTVPWLVLLAVLAGALTRSTVVGVSATFNALIIGIIFSGSASTPQHAAQVAAWVAIGAISQGVVWMAWWPWDRRGHVARALANDLESVRRMCLRPGAFGMEVADSAREEDAVLRALRLAAMPAEPTKVALSVAAWTALVRRSTLTWIEVADPGLVQRRDLADALADLERQLTHGRATHMRDFCVEGDDACLVNLRAAISGLRAAVEAWRSVRSPRTSQPTALLTTDPVAPLDPRRLTWRHGIRVAVGVAIGQVIALLLGDGHAFWIPLTIAFIVKPDWAYTVLRTALRLAGNLAAVVVIGLTASWLVGVPWAFIAVAFILAWMTFRWVSGNYAIDAFAVAGFILLVDTLLDPGQSLVLDRIGFTLVGSVVGIAVALVLPTWVSRDIPAAVGNLLSSLRDSVSVILPLSGSSAAAMDTYLAGLRVRDDLERLRVVAVGTALEPRGRSVSTSALLDLLDRGQVVLIRLWALGGYELMSARTGVDRPVTDDRISRVERDLACAAQAAGVSTAPAIAQQSEPSPLATAMASAAAGLKDVDLALGQDERQRVELLAAELERDVLRLGDSVRNLRLTTSAGT